MPYLIFHHDRDRYFMNMNTTTISWGIKDQLKPGSEVKLYYYSTLLPTINYYFIDGPS